MPDEDSRALKLHPIGVMRTTSATRVEAPRQPVAAEGIAGVIELAAGMNLEHAALDLAGWERIWVIFWFDRNTGWRPKVLPPRSTTGRKGVLATRSPHRPNPLGLSVLRLERVEGLRIFVRDVDMLDGTPVFDIKPYVPYSDAFPDSGSGWIDPQVPDPRPSWQVQFAEQAVQRLDWLCTRIDLPLRERIAATLALGPQPHPYRRIRQLRDGTWQIAVQEWRAGFRVEGNLIHVESIRSGYQSAQLVAAATDPAHPRAVHLAFNAAFP